MPKFSVIISVFNKEKYIGKTLESVLNQTVQDFEIVVVNDGSTDGSEEVIQFFKDNRIRYFFQENSGASAGRNKAIQEAKGEFLALLDADDIWYPNHLEEINKLIAHFPEEKVFATAVEIQSKNGVHPSIYTNISSEKLQKLNYFRASYGSSILFSSATVISKDVVATIGYFDENIKSGQDTDYWVRIGIKYLIAFNNITTVSYKWVPESLSRKSFNYFNKTDFTKFDEAAKRDKYLAKFISINRFSIWMQCKIAGDKKNASFLKSKIDTRLLSTKQKLLLSANATQLKLLKQIKEVLKKAGLRLTAFDS